MIILTIVVQLFQTIFLLKYYSKSKFISQKAGNVLMQFANNSLIKRWLITRFLFIFSNYLGPINLSPLK